MNKKIVADKIRFLRNERSLSARELSLELGQNVNYINLIENEKRSLSMESFFDLCRFFNISPADFFLEKKESISSEDLQILSQFKKLSARQSVCIYMLIEELVSEK